MFGDLSKVIEMFDALVNVIEKLNRTNEQLIEVTKLLSERIEQLEKQQTQYLRLKT